MSETNVELARRAFDAFAERDAAALLAVMHEDVEFLPVTANLTTGGQPYRGHAGIARYLDDVALVWSELRVHPAEFHDLGDGVLALGRIRARGGGMIIDRPTGWLWRMKEGRITWGRVYATQEEALRAAGLTE